MELIRSQREFESFGFAWLKRNALKALEFADRPRGRTIALMNIDLRNGITGHRPSVCDVHADFIRVADTHAVLAESQVSEFECGIAKTIAKGIEGLGGDVPVA